MKNATVSLLVIIISIITLSCKPPVVNNSESIKNIFNLSSFRIEIENSGCFNKSRHTFTATKRKNGYNIKSNETEKSKLIPFLKMDSLKDFLVTRKLNKPLCKCSTMEYIKLSNNEYSVDYSNRCCSGKEATFINDFLGYYELSSQD
ncbi:MAG: hypothetical protein ACPGVD_04435 [Flavobacteriales bacterium]